jgi:hypothetical protein
MLVCCCNSSYELIDFGEVAAAAAFELIITIM